MKEKGIARCVFSHSIELINKYAEDVAEDVAR